VRLKRVRGDSRVVGPDFLQKRLRRYRPLADAVEVAQDRGLLLGQADLATLGIEQQLRAWPKRVRADREDRVLARSRAGEAGCGRAQAARQSGRA
jgi:hypothetical protein